MAPASRYLLWTLVGLIGSLVLCAGFAIVIDPYYVFGTPAVPGLNVRHPEADNQKIAARVHLAERMRPRTLLLGNSRVELGIDPASPEWPAAMTPVFDGGLPGSGLEEAHRVMQAALAGGRLRNVMIAAEFLDTMGDHGSSVPPIRLHVPPLQRWKEQVHDWFMATLSIGALTDSVETVLRQGTTSVNIVRQNGSAELGEYADYVRQVGGYALFDHKEAEYAARFNTYVAPDFSQPEAYATFKAIMRLLDAADESGCAATIVIYPYHAAVLDLLQATSLWASFEQFKRALVRMVSARHPGTRIIDFSGYNSFTTEARPPDGPGRAMKWYWEPGHFRTALGDRMIDRLYHDPGDFGRELRPETIEAALAAIRHERDAAHIPAAGIAWGRSVRSGGEETDPQ